MMFGFACDETDTLMPAPIYWAPQAVQTLTDVRKSGEVPFFRPDGKTQVSFEYVGWQTPAHQTMWLLPSSMPNPPVRMTSSRP